jgi:S-disulfanyl-L-cysteine oxidoreductase SoxD
MRNQRYGFARVVFVAAAAIAIAGWGTSSSADKTAAAGSDQAAEGGKLYGKHCAKCHGDAGQGTKKAPPVVGKAALPLDPPAGAKVRKDPFHTAQDVAAFVAAKMPANKPGSLTTDEYYAILAFDLKANGVDVANKKIDPTTAAAIKLH